MDRTALQALSVNEINTPRKTVFRETTRKTKDVAINDIIQEQLKKMVEIEKLRDLERKRALEAMERSDREARDNADRLRLTLASLTEMEELRREAEVARTEATEALRMKNNLLHRIACQTDMIMQLETARQELSEELKGQNFQVQALEASVNELTLQPRKETVKAVSDPGEVRRIADLTSVLQEAQNTVVDLSSKVVAAEETAVALQVESVLDQVVDDVCRSVQCQAEEDSVRKRLEELRNEVDALTEFANIEREEYEACAIAAKTDLAQAHAKIEKLEDAVHRAETEERAEQRKLARKLETLREQITVEDAKVRRLMAENRRLKETHAELVKESETSKNALREMRSQHGSSVETARREILTKKEDLERERRRSEQLERQLGEAQAQLKALDERAPPPCANTLELKGKLASMEASLRRLNFENRILRSENETLKVRVEVNEAESGGKSKADGSSPSKASESPSSTAAGALSGGSADEVERLREEAEQYKAFARRYKEKMDLRFNEMNKWSEAVRVEVKKNWSQLSTMPEMTPLIRAVMNRKEREDPSASVVSARQRNRRMSVV